MLTTRVDKKKIFQYSAVLGVIFLIIIYVVVTNFIVKPVDESGGGTSGSEKNITKGLIKEVNELNVGMTETEKFKALKENVYIEEKIEDLEVGKKNPFSARVTTATSTASSTRKNIE